VPEKRRDEIGALGGSVNAMAARLDTLVNGQKRFLGDVAHELCSPLARLQLATGIIEERAPADLATAVADVREEVEQMSALVNELLDFTRAGLHPRDAALASVDLAPLVARVLQREAAEVRIALALAPGATVLADAALLERALANLVRNALRYAGDAGPITLTAQLENDAMRIELADCGPGVPSAALARLGEPFYRPDSARTRETGGTGLGLAIVRASVEACRGSVRFSNREPRGFSAELRLKAGRVPANLPH
jgi:two-component system sensor histidine kinase CpxA